MAAGSDQRLPAQGADRRESVQHHDVRRRLRARTCRTGSRPTAPGAVDWALTTTSPHSPTHAAFGERAGRRSATSTSGSPTPVTIVAGDTLSFWHTRGMENGFDGGVVEVSTNGGGTWTDIGAAAFTANGYNATISTGLVEPDRRPAGVHAAPRRTSSRWPAWLRTSGQSILVRFRAASDVSVGGTGWTVDDVIIGREVVTTNHLALTATGLPEPVPGPDDEDRGADGDGAGCADGDGFDAVGRCGLGGVQPAGQQRWQPDHQLHRPVREHRRWGRPRPRPGRPARCRSPA